MLVGGFDGCKRCVSRVFHGCFAGVSRDGRVFRFTSFAAVSRLFRAVSQQIRTVNMCNELIALRYRGPPLIAHAAAGGALRGAKGTDGRPSIGRPHPPRGSRGSCRTRILATAPETSPVTSRRGQAQSSTPSRSLE